MNETYSLAFSTCDERRINARQNGTNKFALLSVGYRNLQTGIFILPETELTLMQLFAFAQANGFAIFQIPNY